MKNEKNEMENEESSRNERKNDKTKKIIGKR